MQVFYFTALHAMNAYELFQDAASHRDDEFVENVNRLLRDPDSIPIWNTNSVENSGSQASTSSPQTSTSLVQPTM
jgi:26S proteasome regulatory subunit N13